MQSPDVSYPSEVQFTFPPQVPSLSLQPNIHSTPTYASPGRSPTHPFPHTSDPAQHHGSRGRFAFDVDVPRRRAASTPLSMSAPRQRRRTSDDVEPADVDLYPLALYQPSPNASPPDTPRDGALALLRANNEWNAPLQIAFPMTLWDDTNVTNEEPLVQDVQPVRTNGLT